jgi:hypothetical protein
MVVGTQVVTAIIHRIVATVVIVLHAGGCSGQGSTDKSSRPQCQVYLKIGHTASNCWHCFEEDYVPETCTMAAASSSGFNNSWYTDSSATDHITGDLDKLTMHDRYASVDQVHAANGLDMAISRIGKSAIPTPLTILFLTMFCMSLPLKKILFWFIVLPWTMIPLLSFIYMSS